MVKVEISIVDGSNKKWQWLGKMSPTMLRILCQLANDLSDESFEESKE